MDIREIRPGSGKRRARVVGAVLAVAAIAVAALAVPLIATSGPGFFAGYHLLERRYVGLEGSAHEGIGCRTCHETRPLADGAALVADFYSSLVTKRELPTHFTFKPPTRDACLQCHVSDWSSDATRTSRIPHPAHLRVASEQRDCASCHKWTAHFEKYMPKHETMPFSGVCVSYGCHSGTKVTRQCFGCHHALHESGTEWRTVHPRIVRTTGDNACMEKCHRVTQCQQCHTTGKMTAFTGLRIETGMQPIEQLHVRRDWIPRFHGTEALKDEKRCMLCHESQDECNECHLQRPAFHGSTATWIGRHVKNATRVDDPRCLTCHKKTWCVDCHKQFKETG